MYACGLPPKQHTNHGIGNKISTRSEHDVVLTFKAFYDSLGPVLAFPAHKRLRLSAGNYERGGAVGIAPAFRRQRRAQVGVYAWHYALRHVSSTVTPNSLRYLA